MALSAFMGKYVKDYEKNSREYINKFLEKQIKCKKCGGVMGYHGHYKRGIREKGITVCIHRIVCKDRSCRHTDAVLPDLLMPYKQYSANEIEAVLIDSITIAAEDIETTAGIATVRRWIKQINNKMSRWIATLKPIAHAVSESADKEYDMAAAKIVPDGLSVIDQLCILLDHLHPVHKSGNLLGSALIYLTNNRLESFST